MYRRLVGKLNYLTMIHLDISFPISVVSQFLNYPCDNHWDVVICIMKYIKGDPRKGLLYEGKIIHFLWDILTMIEQALPLTRDPLPGFAFLLEII